VVEVVVDVLPLLNQEKKVVQVVEENKIMVQVVQHHLVVQ
jgi:hypothetical protein